MFTDSTALKLTGMPLPLLVNPVRMPLTKVSAIWPRMSGVVGAPKLDRVYELEVSLEKSRTSKMLIAFNCSREMMVTFRGVSITLRSVP